MPPQGQFGADAQLVCGAVRPPAMNAPALSDAPARTTDSAAAVYLCQVGRRVSCGACCGLYNVPDLARDSLQERLARRTERFAAVPRTEAAIERFRRQTEGWTPEERPFPQFHHCPFLGLVGSEGSRVGCLLHPEAPGNQGRDWRFLSYYGDRACRSYFCPASRILPSRYLQIICRLMRDWYSYGLIITEHRLQRALFEALERRLGRPLQPAEVQCPAARAHLRKLFDLKRCWPYRRPDGPGLCHFPFDNGLYTRPAVNWPSAARPAAPYRALFQELESFFATETEMWQAVRLVDDLVDALADGFNAGRRVKPGGARKRTPTSACIR